MSRVQHSAAPKRNRKKIIAGAAIAGVLIPGAAWAAVNLFGFGTFTQAAGTTKVLTIEGTPTTTKTLVPGQTVGVKGNVKNSNDFPVKVTGIIVKKGSEKTTGGTAEQCMITFAPGGKTAEFPKNGDDPAVPGSTAFDLKTPVEIPAGFTKEIVVADVLKQDSKAKVLCGVSAEYAVVAVVGED